MGRRKRTVVHCRAGWIVGTNGLACSWLLLLDCKIKALFWLHLNVQPHFIHCHDNAMYIDSPGHGFPLECQSWISGSGLRMTCKKETTWIVCAIIYENCNVKSWKWTSEYHEECHKLFALYLLVLNCGWKLVLLGWQLRGRGLTRPMQNLADTGQNYLYNITKRICELIDTAIK